ncbi:hypothetical protein FISHEDRAFT_65489 [Fistulina hepatica ATCC 64428]|nr:hypothetical protein FISHEDRAFT_65489 [Fistulina hepatica ATCC 64428]
MVRHLPPAVKQLLTLRNLESLPSPPLDVLHGAFERTFRAAKQRRVETGWLTLMTSSLVTVNRPTTLGHLYRFVTRDVPEDAGTRIGDVGHSVNKAALMREAAMKSTIFIGVPRVILSLAALHEALDEDVRAALRKHSRRTDTPESIESTLTRGRALWDSIYAPHQDKLHDKLGGYHPDFIAFILLSYGSVLSPLPGATKQYDDVSGADDPDQGNLSRALGSVVGTACLRAEGRVGPQLISHVFGLLKARYEPNLNEEDKWLSSDEGTEWVVRTVDEVLDTCSWQESRSKEEAKL